MANGFCPALLQDINDIAGQNAPGKKLHIAGFLSMLFCCQNSLASPIQAGTQDGHRRTLTIKYRPRPLVSSVQTEDDCDINLIPAWLEWTVPALTHRQHSFFLEDSLVRQYCKDVSNMRDLGTPRTRVMEEVYGLFLDSANVVMKVVNQALVLSMATEFGENVTTGDAGGTAINFNTNGASNILTDGLIQMMRDIQENEICGDPCVVGGGLWSAAQMAHSLACCNAAGIDFSKASFPKLFFDKDTQFYWGANTAGLFAPGSVKFISFDRYIGEAFVGDKGASFFTNVGLPVNDFGCNLDDCLRDLRLDVQLKYIDCPQNVTINGVSTAVGRGWQVIVSKQFTMWVQPVGAFQTGDSLDGTNGTIKYYASNTAYTGGAYSLY